jgi:hypothetical protein
VTYEGRTMQSATPLRTVADLAALETTTLYPSGGDDSAALQALITTDCDVLLGPGTFQWNTAPVQLPPGATGIRIRGSGKGVTTIKLSAGAPRAFDFNKVADQDVFQNITLSDFTVDCNNVGGKHHGIIGNYKAGVVVTKIQFQNITCERLSGINGPAPSGAGTNDRRWIALWAENDNTDTKLVVENITCRDVDLQGGAYGISVVASRITNESGKYANVEFHKILIDHCQHDTGLVPTEFATCANFHIGSRGYGKSARIVNCYGVNSGDVGIEIDGMTDATVIGCRIRDQWSTAFYTTNFAVVPKLNTQRIIFDKCVAIREQQTANNGTHGFRNTVQNEFNEEYAASLIYRDCSFYSSAPPLSIEGEGMLLEKARNVVVDGFNSVQENAVFVSASGVLAGAIKTVGPGSIGKMNILLRKIKIVVNGERTGAGSLTYLGVSIAGQGKCAVKVEDVDFRFNITNMSSFGTRPVQIGNEAGLTLTVLSCLLRKIWINEVVGDSEPRGVIIQDTNWLTIPDRIELVESDFSEMPNGPEVLFATSGGGTAQPSKLVARNNRTRAGSTALEGARAQATEVKLPPQGEYVAITGEAAELKKIEAQPAGRRVTLQFTAATPKKVVAGENLKLAGNFEPAKNNTLSLVCDGTNWYEMSRSAVT